MKRNNNNHNDPEIAIILTDANRHIQWVNEGFTTITGYTMMEVIGKKPSILQGKETEKEVILRIRDHLEAPYPVSFKEEITNYRKNGEAYFCRLVVHPIFNAEQELVNFIAFEIDSTFVKDDSSIASMQLKPEDQKPKYLSSPLSNLQEANLFHQLIALMKKERLYLDSTLKIATLADKLKTNTRYLSQVVNHQTGENLARFINRYRIEEVKKKIIDPSNDYLTIFAIASMCGFKTKSTFYKCFKEIAKMTPKDYLEQYRDSKLIYN